MRSYAELQRRMTATFVPVHNELVSLMFAREDFPPTRPECGVIRIPRLSPIVRGVIDRPSFSFSAYMTKQPGGPTEIHQWIGNIFTEFRDFELRLLMGRLSSSLGGVPAPTKRQARALSPPQALRRALAPQATLIFCGGGARRGKSSSAAGHGRPNR